VLFRSDCGVYNRPGSFMLRVSEKLPSRQLGE
jgi:hypothetical protein